MSTPSTSDNDRPVNEGAVDSQQTAEESPSLVMENERLRGEIMELRRMISRMEGIQKQQQQQQEEESQHRTFPLLPSFPNSRQTKQEHQPVLVEMPVILSHNRSTKDHQSVSTADDRETVEPTMDIEAHQSSGGLHHRSPRTSSYKATSIVTTPSNASSTISTVSTTKTRRTEPMTDDGDSSSTKDCYNDEDDPLAESRGLIAADGGPEKDGILLVESSAVGNDNEGNPNLHQMTFWQSLTDRAGWLIGLLVFQSLSSFILARNELLLQKHTVIVQFLTMLVGAGGNAGNQASVGVVRGIAVGMVNRSNVRRVLGREFTMGVALSLILGLAGFVRAKAFAVPWTETIAITTSLFLIVIISVIVGASLPVGMEAVGIDPAHSSTTIQVVMDITGVVITVQVCSLMLADLELPDSLASVLDDEFR